MNADDILTMQQAEEEMRCLRKVFPVVRLLKGSEFEKEPWTGVAMGNNPNEPCRCYDYWEKSRPCENCISKRAYDEKTQLSKLEYLGLQPYQVYARYVEIDGVPYVMEMIKRLDEEIFSEIENSEKNVAELSDIKNKLYIDSLTGAYNRRFYDDRVKRATGPAGVALMDFDDIKECNDTYGHHAGDIVLATAADVIKNNIRKTDILIRYGGDEFIIFLPDIDAASFSEKLKLIRKEIYNTKIPGFENVRLSVSIGGVMLHDGNVSAAVSRADNLMYRAKMHKNSVIMEHESDIEEESLADSGIRPVVLIVDDSEINRNILSDMLRDDYRILEAYDGDSASGMLREHGSEIAVVLLDIVMPNRDGFSVLEEMNSEHWVEDIPVIVISSKDDGSYIRKAYNMGVSDYISRPFDVNIVKQRVLNIVKLFAKQRRLMQLVSSQIYEREKGNRIMVGILSHIVEFRNGESGMHVIHINMLTRLILEQLMLMTDKYQLTWDDRYQIAIASALHDIGKIGINEKILNKPGRLTPEEFEIMKTHTIIGAEMLDKLEIYRNEKQVKLAHDICRWHHERWDGRGYPDGLRGDEIPISAQVVSLADVYDALVSKRVYKEAYSHDKAIQMILDGECGQFNPILIDCLMKIKDKLREEIHSDFLDDGITAPLGGGKGQINIKLR